jgi:hypothetical protein
MGVGVHPHRELSQFLWFQTLTCVDYTSLIFDWQGFDLLLRSIRSFPEVSRWLLGNDWFCQRYHYEQKYINQFLFARKRKETVQIIAF